MAEEEVKVKKLRLHSIQQTLMRDGKVSKARRGNVFRV